MLAILPFILIQIHQYVLAATTNGDEPSKRSITAIKNCTKEVSIKTKVRIRMFRNTI